MAFLFCNCSFSPSFLKIAVFSALASLSVYFCTENAMLAVAHRLSLCLTPSLFRGFLHCFHNPFGLSSKHQISPMLGKEFLLSWIEELLTNLLFSQLRWYLVMMYWPHGCHYKNGVANAWMKKLIYHFWVEALFLLCSSGWLQTHDSPAWSSLELGLQT